MGSMMMLVVAKRVKAYEKANIYGDEMLEGAGISPTALMYSFAAAFLVIILLAVLRFVNETLVCAVVICILLFIYMLKITLFETEEPLMGKKGSDYYGGGLFT